jgi:hypothetical protein
MYAKCPAVEEFIFTGSEYRCFVLEEVTMFLFFAGLIVGAIFGIALIAILSSGAAADQWMESQLKEMDRCSPDCRSIVTTKN